MRNSLPQRVAQGALAHHSATHRVYLRPPIIGALAAATGSVYIRRCRRLDSRGTATCTHRRYPITLVITGCRTWCALFVLIRSHHSNYATHTKQTHPTLTTDIDSRFCASWELLNCARAPKHASGSMRATPNETASPTGTLSVSIIAAWGSSSAVATSLQV